MRALKSIQAEAEKLARDWPDRVTEAPVSLGVQNIAVEGPCRSRNRRDDCR